MALWGKTDAVASAPKWVARKATFDSSLTSVVNATNNTINLIPSNTGFNTGDSVAYSINGGTVIGGLTNATTYFTRVVGAGVIELYDTYAHAIAAEPTKTGRLDISGLGVGAQTLQNTGAANAFGDSNYNGSALVFVDSGEATVVANRAKGIKNAGWWLYRTWTNADGSVAQHSECLVAMQGADVDLIPSVTGDREDAITVDALISIGTQPVARTVTRPAAGTFTIVATVPTATSITYQWQVQEGGTGSWANVSRGTGGTTASYTTGATLIPGASGAATNDNNGDKYRCVVSASGYADVTSNAVALTVL